MPAKLIKHFLTDEAATRLAQFCREQLADVPRKQFGRSRIIRYGWDYHDPNKWVRDIPEEFLKVATERFDSVTLNEYESGRDIGPHIDSLAFGNDILILSLGASATFVFHVEPGDFGANKIILENGSLFHFWGRDRFEVKHSVQAVSGLRYSVVFRFRRDEP